MEEASTVGDIDAEDNMAFLSEGAPAAAAVGASDEAETLQRFQELTVAGHGQGTSMTTDDYIAELEAASRDHFENGVQHQLANHYGEFYDYYYMQSYYYGEGESTYEDRMAPPVGQNDGDTVASTATYIFRLFQ